MTDRELLELAAKAAGIDVVGYADRLLVLPEYDGSLIRRHENGGDVEWNPLADDGDAFRLAVKLGITMYPAESVGDCATTTFPDGKWVTVESSGDPLADLRRAIVLAAAEIGKAMP
jgi:hypothetical protein